MEQKIITPPIISPASQNREYKDRLFKFIFGRDTPQSKKWLLSLYNALNHSHHTNIDDLTLTTIENVIYITMKNDLSFLIDDQLTLYEQQSTYNPNMPLRGMMYFAQLYQMYLSRIGEDLFTSRLIKIPSPRFVVFYNGKKELPDVCEYRLSDSFEIHDATGKFEWTATMININADHNKALQKSSKPLYDYCSYVSEVREFRKKFSWREAIEKAVDFAIKENLLDGFFKQQRMEILDMSLTEFDQEEYDRNRRREGAEQQKAEDDARWSKTVAQKDARIAELEALLAKSSVR